MQNFSTPSVALTKLTQWQAHYTSLLERVSALHQTKKISPTDHQIVLDYLEKFNQALEAYFTLKTLPQQTEQLQTLLDELRIFIAKNQILAIAELLTELQTILKATQDQLLKPMDINQLPPEILNQIASDNFTSREALNLGQSSRLLFFGDAGLSFLAKRKRLPELGKFKLITRGNDCFFYTQNKLFVWGKNELCQLGLGDNDNRNFPLEFDLTHLQLAPEDGVAQVIAGGHHTILLTRQGRCFVWGYNFYGQLGLGDNVIRHFPLEFDLTRLQLAPDDGVAQIVAGTFHTLLITRQGRCFVWGKNENGQLGLGDDANRNEPEELNLARLPVEPGDEVAQVVAGACHTILLTRQGRCFVWGMNVFGQLGLGDNVDRNVPVKLNLAGLRLSPEDGVAQVVAGSAYHTILLTRQGRCFVWGENELGQLGLGDNNNRNEPEELNLAGLGLLPGDGVAQVIAGERHTLLLTRQGRCFVWGDNRRGQLGLGDNVNRNGPVELNLAGLGLLPEDGVTQVIAGAHHTILLTRQGRCFVCGENRFGQLGLGYDSEPIPTPTEVFYPQLKELKNLWSALQKEDLATLAPLACDEENYGQTTYQLMVKRLAFENTKTRLAVIPLIHASPWHQLPAVTKLLPFASLYQPLIEILRATPSSEKEPIINALVKLLDVYNYFIDKDSSSEQITCQEDFVELLKTLCQGGLQDSDGFSKYLEKTAATRHLKNFRFTLLDTSFDLPLPNFLTPYFNVRQELLTEAKQNPEFLSHLKTAADILLQGLNAATEADSLAYTLRALLQPKQQFGPIRPGAGLSS